MKKIISLLILIVVFIPTVAFATDGFYDTVSIITSFSEDVTISEVGEVILEVSDTNDTYEITLNEENNYAGVLTELIMIGNVDVKATGNNKYIYDVKPVLGDTTGKIELIISLDKTVITTKKVRTTKSLTQEEKDRAVQKLQQQNKRYTIYKIIFGIIFGIILVIGCIAGIKIVKANR